MPKVLVATPVRNVNQGYRSGWGYHSGLGGKMIFIDKAYWTKIAAAAKAWDLNVWYIAEAFFYSSSHKFELTVMVPQFQ